VTLWLETISKYVPQDATHIILDLGCGTGRFTQALSDHFSAQVYGIDPSRKMLTMARRTTPSEPPCSPLMVLVQGSAEHIPLADGMADLVFLSMVYHHLQDKGQAVREFRRVLKAGGLLCIRTSTQESMDSYPWLRFFPGAREIELDRAPSRKGMTDFLQGHGFAPQGHTIVRQLFAENLGQYYDKISLRGLSSLQAITDDEFYEGLAGLKKYCCEQETGEAVFEGIDLFLFRNAERRSCGPTEKVG